MNKRLELIHKIYFFETKKQVIDSWGTKKDWAMFFDKNNYQNFYDFVNELIENKVLINGGTIQKEGKEYSKYSLNKVKLKLDKLWIGEYIFQKNLHKMLEDIEEYKIIKSIIN